MSLRETGLRFGSPERPQDREGTAVTATLLRPGKSGPKDLIESETPKGNARRKAAKQVFVVSTKEVSVP
ncbi:hypothetical protein Sm713_61530 [Streptomyces sp. TS71-3]|nr:hypothetical protein Sm713_61530 [Streptomyces sp. TS71-3]